MDISKSKDICKKILIKSNSKKKDYKLPLSSFYLNKKACNQFIKLSNPEVQTICRKIFDNTQYIPYETFINNFNKIIKEYLDQYYESHHLENKRPIFIYNKSFDKYKSSYWLLTHTIKELKTKINSNIEIIFVKNLTEKKLKPNDIIIFIDDCIYSGTQLGVKIAYLSKFKDKYKFYILVPYHSQKAINVITEIFEGEKSSKSDIEEETFKRKNDEVDYSDNLIFPENMEEILPINCILTDNESRILESFYNHKYNFINAHTTYLIYFDHKLADKISIPTIFYLGIVPNNKNSAILANLNDNTELNNPEILNNLDIIPVINNCFNFTKKIDLFTPYCPQPPYKNTFNDFIIEMKKLNIYVIKSLPKQRILKSYKFKSKIHSI